MRRIANSGGRGGLASATFAAIAFAIVMTVVAACGTSTATPTTSDSGFVSVAPPATDTATALATAPTASATPMASATPAATALPTPLAVVSISLSPVASGFASAIGVSSAPGDARLFVIQQTGQVVIVSGGKRGGIFLDISARMSCCGERGLLGLAFHPEYATNGRFFARYTTPAGDLRVSEFHVSTDPNKADAASERVIITIPHPSFANHNGGRIEFGPDGYLYIGTGDGGSGGDPNNHGQALNTLLGKLLRIDVDHAAAGLVYAIPDGNPFVGQAGKRSEIWSYGLRNPYTFSFDRETHDLWIADVGQDAYEEVDVEPPGSGRHDYGWSVMEGLHCYGASTCNQTGFTLPAVEYPHSLGCAVTGGYVYRGSAYPSLVGRYVFGDYCSGRLFAFIADDALAGRPVAALQVGQVPFSISSFGQDEAGELYVVDLAGAINRLTAQGWLASLRG